MKCDDDVAHPDEQLSEVSIRGNRARFRTAFWFDLCMVCVCLLSCMPSLTDKQLLRREGASQKQACNCCCRPGEGGAHAVERRRWYPQRHFSNQRFRLLEYHGAWQPQLAAADGGGQRVSATLAPLLSPPSAFVLAAAAATSFAASHLRPRITTAVDTVLRRACRT